MFLFGWRSGMGLCLWRALLPLVALSLRFAPKRSGNRNLFFVGLLLLFAVTNLLFHLSRLGVAFAAAPASRNWHKSVCGVTDWLSGTG